MPIYNASGALKVYGDQAGNIEVRQTGSLVNQRAFFLDFSGSAVQSVTTSGNGVVIALTGGTGSSSGESFFFSRTAGVIEQSGSLHMSGAGLFKSGLTGALNVLPSGAPFLNAGSNITLSTASNGQITINAVTGSAGAAGATNEIQYNLAGALTASSNLWVDAGNVLHVSGNISASQTVRAAALSGSLTRLSNGLSYLLSTGSLTLTTNSSGQVVISASYGNVSGPASSTDNALVRWDGTGGTVIQNSSMAVLTDLGNLILSSSSGSAVVVTSSIDFASRSTNVPHHEGRLFYDQNEHAMAYYNDSTEMTIQLGQENVIRVWNGSGATIANGSACYVSGAQDNEFRIAVGLAVASTASRARVIGVATNDIPNNTHGYITGWGLVNGVNLSAFNDADTLYLSDTTPGGYRNTPPPAGNYLSTVGYVQHSGSSDGRIFVKIVADATEQIGALSQGVTGLYNGGALSTNSVSASRIDISAGSGVVVDTQSSPVFPIVTFVSWAASSSVAITNIASSSFTYIMMTQSGSVFQVSDRLPTPQEARANIVLGRVGHPTHVTASALSRPYAAVQPVASFFDFAVAVGPFNITGHEYVASGSSLFVNRTSGSLYAFGHNFQNNVNAPNTINLSSSYSIPLSYRYRDGSGGWITSSSNGVDPSVYDDGDGVRGAVGTSQWTIQRFYLSSTGATVVYLGQTRYGTFSVAQAAIEDPVQVDPALGETIFRGWLVVRGNTTNLSDTANNLFVNAANGPGGAQVAGSSGVTDHGGLLGLEDDDHTQYLLVSGSRAMAGNLNMGAFAIGNVSTFKVDSFQETTGSATFKSIVNIQGNTTITGNLGVRSNSPSSSLHVSGNISVQDEVRFWNNASNRYVGFQAPTTIPSSVTWIWPSSSGDVDSVLTLTASNQLVWKSVTSSAVPATYWYSDVSGIAKTTGSIEVTGSALIKTNLNVTGSSIFSGSATFYSGLSGSLTRLSNGNSYLVAGTNVTISSASNGSVTISATGGSGDVLWFSPSNENVRTTGSIEVSGSALIKTNLNVTGSSNFNGVATFTSGLSGSLTQLSNGLSYIVAGANVTVTSQSNGSITIASTGGSGDVLWFSPSNENVRTTGSIEVTGSALIKQNLNVTGSSTFSGSATFYSGLSGSLTRLSNGLSYIVAGTNVTVTSASNGSITISATGGSGGRTFLWNANGENDFFAVTTGSSGFDISASFDGVRRVNTAATIGSAFGMLLEAGTAGSSSVEVYRRRGSTMTRLVSFNIPFSAGDYSITSGTLHTTDLEVGDLLYSQFTGIMTGGRDLSFEVNAS